MSYTVPKPGRYMREADVASLIDTVDAVAAVDWRGLHMDLAAGAARDLPVQQWIALSLACSLGDGAAASVVSLHLLLDVVQRLPDPADRDALSGLILSAVRTALTDRPAVTR